MFLFMIYNLGRTLSLILIRIPYGIDCQLNGTLVPEVSLVGFFYQEKQNPQEKPLGTA